MPEIFITASSKPRSLRAGDEDEARLQSSADEVYEADVNLERKPRTFSSRKFIRRIKPGELMYFGGGEISSTHTEKYPFNWGRFKTMARGQLRKIGESGAFSEQNIADVNGILGELVRRNKSPLHPLFKSGVSLLMEKLPEDIVARPELTDGEKEAAGYVLALQNALKAREKSNGDRP